MGRTCDVPELKPDRLRIPVQHLQGEVHSDGGPVVVGVGLVHVAPDDGGLPDSQVPDHQHLVQVLLPEALHAVGLRRVVAHAPRGTRSFWRFRPAGGEPVSVPRGPERLRPELETPSVQGSTWCVQGLNVNAHRHVHSAAAHVGMRSPEGLKRALFLHSLG